MEDVKNGILGTLQQLIQLLFPTGDTLFRTSSGAKVSDLQSESLRIACANLIVCTMKHP